MNALDHGAAEIQHRTIQRLEQGTGCAAIADAVPRRCVGDAGGGTSSQLQKAIQTIHRQTIDVEADARSDLGKRKSRLQQNVCAGGGRCEPIDVGLGVCDARRRQEGGLAHQGGATALDAEGITHRGQPQVGAGGGVIHRNRQTGLKRMVSAPGFPLAWARAQARLRSSDAVPQLLRVTSKVLAWSAGGSHNAAAAVDAANTP